jgi:hypothetical protein
LTEKSKFLLIFDIYGSPQKYSPVEMGMEAKISPETVWGGERGSFLCTFPAPLTSLSMILKTLDFVKRW